MTRVGTPPPGKVWQKYDKIESRLTASVSERMLDLAEIAPGMRLLDIATGRGEPAIRAAKRVGPKGYVLGIDTSDDVLEIARAQAAGDAITNVEFRIGDAELLDGLPRAPFDVVTCRWGLMYMRAPVRALSRAQRALRPGGALVAAFWAEPDRVPWATLTRTVLSRYCSPPLLNPNEPGPFRYATIDSVALDFAQAGFSIEKTEEMPIAVMESKTAQGIADWCVDLGFARQAFDLTSLERDSFLRDLVAEAEKLRESGIIRLHGVTRIVVARS